MLPEHQENNNLIIPDNNDVVLRRSSRAHKPVIRIFVNPHAKSFDFNRLDKGTERAIEHESSPDAFMLVEIVQRCDEDFK